MKKRNLIVIIIALVLVVGIFDDNFNIKRKHLAKREDY